MPFFSLRKQFSFEAAHRLPHHDGKCNRLHGHSWRGWIEVVAEEVITEGPKTGMVMDFGDMSRHVKAMVDAHLDHYYLNESLQIESPTSELVAEWIYEYLAAHGLDAHAVTIEETCTSSCTYRPISSAGR